MLKIIYKSIISILLIFVITISSWYVIDYFSYLPELKKIEQVSRTEYGSEVLVLKKLAMVAETEQGIKNYVARMLVFELRDRERTLKRHGVTLLWLVGNNIHFSNDQLFYLWLHVSKVNELSIKYYQSPVSALTLEQKASIVGMIKGPSIYKPNNERGIKRQQWLLNQYHNS